MYEALIEISIIHYLHAVIANGVLGLKVSSLRTE